MTRKHNFSAGPAALPEAVLARAAEEMLDWHGKGLSIMEMSHRSPEFVSVAEAAEQDLRDLMDIPANYKVLFLQGGATSQFGMVPMNLLRGAGTADYIDTGIWSAKAMQEASRYTRVGLVASTQGENYTRVPAQAELTLNPEAAYVHYTSNETIGGLEFDYVPETGEVPLVVDMSSDILARPIDVSRYGLIYAGAQKNIGPAGLTVVIVREELLGNTLPGTPTMFDYKVHADADSMNNTPPTFAWYMTGLVFKWLKEQGGVEGIARLNERKASSLYAAIDASDFYANPIAPANRSIMNVPFTLADSALDKLFLERAEQAGLLNLKGHRSVGGMRASIYNAVSQDSVDALIAFMQEFERTAG
ncbi:Phosphoserine aminotransferase [Marinobacterium lacunae]|uniref:Phosphoserine aminotransferase n=1 Tax=Marinobacterium lacunae TaxID=1232683 RepID=A0A081G3S9_9GAMM|nr:3-phosphoserine/phosphohydroxythreonine transaminase [Marinobacterium lacunae]KEA65434.1 Phosphoserine aminotransferase [Marinobacterium lacunae]MBR9882655.1 3-phosphoserine/phosphohydroxythreonine transaminase [Oceanospirillales bacterium]